MKKRAILIPIIIFLALGVISALDLSLSKTQYFPGETLQLEIPDSFSSSLTLNNIGIYSNDSVHKIPAEADIIKSEGKYLYYAVLPEAKGDYTLKLENPSDSSDIAEEAFTVASTNSSYLSFNKGFIYSSSDFSLKIKAYNAEQTINVDFTPSNFKQSFKLGYGNEKTVYIPIGGIKGLIKSNIKINSYSIPAIIVGGSVITNTTNNTLKPSKQVKDLIELDILELDTTILPDSNFLFNFRISNKNESVENVNITSQNTEIKINPLFLPLLNNTVTINVTINSKKDLNGSIKISVLNESLILPVRIKITKNETNVNSSIINPNNKNCATLQGKMCAEGEDCSEYRMASDGLCCVSECVKPQGSNKWIYGLILLIIVGVGAWFFIKKAREKQQAGKSDMIIRKRAEGYEHRITPDVTSNEVRDSLGKI